MGLAELPQVVLDLPDRLVVLKPPNWEVDSDSLDVQEPAHKLSSFLQVALLPQRWPLTSDASLRHGMVHRIDVPCSGLVLCAKTYEAFYDLKFQLHSAHIGHPVVFDGKYSTMCEMESDKSWCPRNFLHRYHLGFRDDVGHVQSALSSLPGDLAGSLASHMPRCASPASAEILQEWRSHKRKEPTACSEMQRLSTRQPWEERGV